MGMKDFFFNNSEKIYNNFPDGIIVLDFMRNIIMWNQKAELIFGYSKSEIKNKNIILLFNEDFDKFNKIIGLNHGSILHATTKTGEKIFVDVTAFDSYNSARIIVSVRALSNKYLELESLLDDYKITKQLVSDRDSFLSSMKLDFLTPINSTIGFSQSLLDEAGGKLNAKQKKYVEIINSNGKKLKNLTDKVFEIISLDAGKKEFNFKNFDFQKLIEFSVEKYNSQTEENKIEILIENLTQKRNAYSDEYAFIQIIEILLDNAIKYGDNKNITIKLFHPESETLEFHDMKCPAGYTEEAYLQIEIADLGAGISEEQATEIFDEYSAKNLAFAQKHEGTALSLPIAKKLANKLGGTLWYLPNTPAGSVFTLLIPVERMNFE